MSTARVWNRSHSTRPSMASRCFQATARSWYSPQIGLVRCRARRTCSSRTGWSDGAKLITFKFSKRKIMSMNFRQLQRMSRYLVLLIALCFITVAQQPTQSIAPSAERLRETVTYLASDALEGRRTGSTGANLGAEYVAREFARYGLRRSIGVDRPGMSILEADSPRRYMQEFPYVAGVELGKKDRKSVV